jgi:hypothetical protein
MRFDRHPEISEAWLRAARNAEQGLQPYMPHSDKVSRRSLLEKEDVRRLVGYAKELGIEVVPEVQSLAHVQYITYAHPEIAEIEEKEISVDTRGEDDARPASFYAHCYCASNPLSYEIIYDIIDEIVEVVKPKEYVHMGHDEVYQIGLCKRCRGTDPAVLYAKHVCAMHDYLAKKGYKMIIWSDMIHPAPVRDYPTYKAIDMIPKDILMLDFVWYFHPELDIEDNLLKAGYKVAVGNLYSSHYTRFKSRISKDGMVGGEVSMWLITDETILGENGKLWDIIYLSEMLWNTEGYEESNRKAYTEIISKKIQPGIRDRIRGKFLSSGYTARELTVIGSSEGIPDELKALCPKTVIPGGAVAEPGAAYDRLIFEHSTIWSAPRIAWQPNLKIGEYTVIYEDGSFAKAELRYDRNIMCYKCGYAEPKPQQYYRHLGYVGTWFADPAYQGKSDTGEDITVLGFLWENPSPEKKIMRIEYKPEENDYTCLSLSGIKGLIKNS